MRAHVFGILCVGTFLGACGDSASNQGGGISSQGGSGAGSTDGGNATGGENAGGNGGCVPPVTPPALPPASACLPDIPCAADSDCPDGHRCNDALSPPSCEELYCGAEGTICSDDVFCIDGLTCFEGGCRSCDVCGTESCAIDFMTSAEHCGCCNNPVPASMACVDGMIQCPSEEGVEYVVCGDACVELDGDDANCGECGATCAGGSNCQDGVCVFYVEPPARSCDVVCQEAGLACDESWPYSGAYYSNSLDEMIFEDIDCDYDPPEEIDCPTLGTCWYDGGTCGCIPMAP